MRGERRRGPWLALALLSALLGILGCGGTQPAALAADSAEGGRSSPSIVAGQLAPGELPSAIPVEADDVVWGSALAPATIVEFVDYQCPFCSRVSSTLRALEKKYGPDRLRVVYKHLPLDMHPEAFGAALAVQAVKELAGDDKARLYMGRLLENQRALNAANLEHFAVELGVQAESFRSHLQREELRVAVENDVALAARLNINGTPAFRINGFALDGAYPLERFVELVDAELLAAERLTAAGLRAAEVYSLRVSENLDKSKEAERDHTVYRALIDGSPTLGPADALVTIVEFSDFQCPFCRKVRATLARLREKYADDLRFVFKHLPLSFHEHAAPAARLAAEIHSVAGDEAFWRSEQRLFAMDLHDEELLALGVEAGLSEVAARAALDGNSGQGRVDRDLNLAEEIEAEGAPHFFINGQRIVGAQPYEVFDQLVQSELDKARAAVRQGSVEPGDYYALLMQRGERPGGSKRVDFAIPSADSPSRGPIDAPIQLHVFSDFQCPYCARVEPTLIELEKTFEPQIRVVWHDFPLPFHEHARVAAKAAREAFAQQGAPGFWKMHALLFQSHQLEDGPRLSPKELGRLASLAGLDRVRFERALGDETHEGAIEADLALTKKLGLEATPSFVINGYVTSGARPLSHFVDLVARVLREQARQGDPSKP